jgi:integrase/recombinase XerD
VDSSDVGTLVAAWLASQRSENTRSAYARDIARFLEWCSSERVDPLSVGPRALRRYRSEDERAGASPATTARRLSAISSFGVHATAAGATTELSDVARPVVARRSTTTVLSDADAAALLAAADRMPVRAAALLRLLMLDGLKVGEAVGADADDISGRPPAMTLRVGSRVVELHPDTARALHRYLSRRRTGPLILSEGRVRASDRLTRFGVDFVIKEVVRAAGVAAPVSGNTLRRRYIVAARAGGTEVAEIGRDVGHADPRTTRRYLDPRAEPGDRP